MYDLVNFQFDSSNFLNSHYTLNSLNNYPSLVMLLNILAFEVSWVVTISMQTCALAAMKIAITMQNAVVASP